MPLPSTRTCGSACASPKQVKDGFLSHQRLTTKNDLPFISLLCFSISIFLLLLRLWLGQFMQSLKMKDGEISGLGETILTDTSPRVNRRLEEVPQMPVLASKYDISVPDVFYCDSSEFMFRFDLSDFVTNDMMYFNLSRGDECEFDIWDNSVSQQMSITRMVYIHLFSDYWPVALVFSSSDPTRPRALIFFMDTAHCLPQSFYIIAVSHSNSSLRLGAERQWDVGSSSNVSPTT